MSISVTMRNGTCKWLATEEPVIVVCTPIVNCQPTVLRQWSGLGANTGLDFCVTANGETLCLINPPSAGPSGSGEDTRTSASMQCQDGAVRSFSIVSSSCGLSAAGEAICSSCVSH